MWSRAPRRIQAPGFLLSPFSSRRTYSFQRPVQEHDTVLLEVPHKGGEWRLHLAGPLKAGETFKLRDQKRTKFEADGVIGKSSRDVIKAGKYAVFRIQEPSLGAFMLCAPRGVTPIYPADANFIVNLLDINLPVPGEDPVADAQPPFEIFEAGTGMGSLTMHLARAIHGANPPLPPALRQTLIEAPYLSSSRPDSPDPTTLPSDSQTSPTSPPPDPLTHDPHPLAWPSPSLAASYATHLSTRRAIIHTLDNRPSHSRNAHRNARRFRRALYLPDIAFHVCPSPEPYLSARLLESGGAPFLAHAVLDLPDAWGLAGRTTVRALRPDGLLVVFAAQLTQVVRFAAEAARARAPLRQERVVELANSTVAGGSGGGGGEGTLGSNLAGAGGREWDVRLVRSISSSSSSSSRKADKSDRVVVEDGDGDVEDSGGAALPVDIDEAGEERLVSVCRPKVGAYVAGGGFVAVFRKLSTEKPWPAEEGAGIVEEDNRSTDGEGLEKMDQQNPV